MVMAAQPDQFAPDNTITPAEGALFNAKLCGPELYENGDRSKGAHNVFLCEALLRASIDEVRATYGLPAPPVAAQKILSQRLGGKNAGAVRISRTSVWR